jgi:type IV pilus assembly protein PilN
VILINLLPHREEARKRSRETFYAYLGLSALVAGLIAGAIFLWYQTQIRAQESRNNFLKAETQKLEDQIKEIAQLQEEINALKARQQAVQDLQSDRNLPVQLLNDFVAQLPEGVYITKIEQKGNTSVDFTGTAQSNDRITELLRNIDGKSETLHKSDLVEIRGGTVTLSPKDIRSVANFTMRAAVRRPAASAAEAASGQRKG